MPSGHDVPGSVVVWCWGLLSAIVREPRLPCETRYDRWTLVLKESMLNRDTHDETLTTLLRDDSTLFGPWMEYHTERWWVLAGAEQASNFTAEEVPK